MNRLGLTNLLRWDLQLIHDWHAMQWRKMHVPFRWNPDGNETFREKFSMIYFTINPPVFVCVDRTGNNSSSPWLQRRKRKRLTSQPKSPRQQQQQQIIIRHRCCRGRLGKRFSKHINPFRRPLNSRSLKNKNQHKKERNKAELYKSNNHPAKLRF